MAGKENNNEQEENHFSCDIDIDLKKNVSIENDAFAIAAKSSTSASFWKKQSSSYVATVLESSRTLSGTAPLQLQESESALLNACRASVKAATEEKHYGVKLLNELLVATHGLRALTTIVDTPDTAMKLVYHAIVTLSDRLMTATKDDEIQRAVSIGLALYETLGALLKGVENIKFVASKSTLFLFPVPLSSSKSSSPAQVLKIGIQSTLAVCNILMRQKRSYNTLEFGKVVAKIMTRDDSVEVVRNAVLKVCIPWNQMHATNKESHKECVTFAKAAHRLLWDAAASSPHDNIALALRRDAILALVLATTDKSPATITRLVSTKCSELAATYAWKAAATHVKQVKLGVPAKELRQFHTVIGKVLDSIATPKCLSYIEYCAYRALHVGPSSASCKCTPFRELPFDYRHDCAAKSSNLGEATLALVFLTSSLHQELNEEGNFNLETLPHYDSVESMLQVCSSALKAFQSALARDKSDDVRRCYRMLQQTIVSQRFSRLRKVIDDIGEFQVSSTYLAVMDVCASVLSQSMVAILQTLIRTEKDAKVCQGYWDAMVDAYSRVISLYDAIDSKATDSSLADKVDQLLIAAYEAIDVTKPSFSSVERFAKLLFSIGKRRHDTKTPATAVVPLVYSVNFLTRLESIRSNEDFVRSSQLMSRYSYVASALLSLDMQDAALLAIVAALAYDAVAEPKERQEPLDSAIAFLLDLSSGAPSSTPNSRLSLIHRLTTILEVLDTPSEISDVKPTVVSISETMMDLTMKRSNDNGLELELLLTGAFSDTLSRCLPDSRDAVREQQAKTTALLLMALGDAIKRQSREEGPSSNLHLELKSSSRLLYRLLKRIGATNDAASFFQGIAHFVAASSLTPNDNCKEVRKLYWQQLDRATKALDEARNDDRLGLLASLLWLDVIYRRIQLLGGSKEVSLICACEEVVQEFLVTDADQEVALLSKSFRCFQVLLSKLQSQFSLDGDRLKAAKAAHWNVLLSQKCGSDEHSEYWFAAGAITSLKRADFSSFASALVDTNYSEPRSTNGKAHLFSIESWIANLRLQVAIDQPGKLDDHVSDLLGYRESIGRLSKTDRSDSYQILLLWVESSRLLALSEAYARLQQAHDAIESSKKCIKNSQNGIRLLTKGRFDETSQHFSISSLENLFLERQLESMLLLSQVYDILGDYRKAEAYLISASAQAGLQVSTGTRVDLISLGKSSCLIKSTQQMICYRSLVSLKSQLHSTKQLKTDIWKRVAWSDTAIELAADEDLEVRLEQLHTLTTFLCNRELQNNSIEDRMVKNLLASTDALDLSFSKEITSPFGSVDAALFDTSIFGNMVARVKLCQAQNLLTASCKSNSNFNAAEAICSELIDADPAIAPSLCALAYYYLGLIHLGFARKSGELRLLWEGAVHEVDDLQSAREAFELGLELVDASAVPLKRDLCRSLALVLGTTERSKKLGLSADVLVHSSIGMTSKTKFLRNLRAARETKGSRMEQLFEAQGDHLFDVARNCLPTAWNVIAIALCPTGEMLLAGLQNDTRECICIFPDQVSDNLFDSSIYNNIMMPLDELIHKSDSQLNGMDENKATDEFEEESAKRDWWSVRKELDSDLRRLLDHTEELYFECPNVKRFFGVAPALERSESGESMPRGNLASKFEAAFEDVPAKSQTPGEPNDNDCLIMVLDENLHRFPFEGLSFLHGRAVTRVPSLPFLLAPLLESATIQVDASDVRYVVDPESNLGKTAERIMPFIESTSERNAWNWSGVVGEFPTEDFVVESITKEDGLFLYCGHGGGKGSFSKSKVESLVEQSDSPTPCRSTIILMGCSSGKLASINRKNTDASERAAIHYEPEGIALSYILAGAPCVVGNLWDVTDRDIDRYCMAFMKEFLTEGGGSLAKCMAEARSSCKMKHIVGLAPVCYGLPVVRKEDA